MAFGSFPEGVCIPICPPLAAPETLEWFASPCVCTAPAAATLGAAGDPEAQERRDTAQRRRDEEFGRIEPGGTRWPRGEGPTRLSEEATRPGDEPVRAEQAPERAGQRPGQRPTAETETEAETETRRGRGRRDSER